MLDETVVGAEGEPARGVLRDARVLGRVDDDAVAVEVLKQVRRQHLEAVLALLRVAAAREGDSLERLA